MPTKFEYIKLTDKQIKNIESIVENIEKLATKTSMEILDLTIAMELIKDNMKNRNVYTEVSIIQRGIIRIGCDEDLKLEKTTNYIG